MSELQEKIEFIDTLNREVDGFYDRLFQLNTGGKFHAMVEWCGVMKEWLAIHRGLLVQGIDGTDNNIHSGKEPVIPTYQANYMAEKIQCIFNGMLVVTAAEDKP